MTGVGWTGAETGAEVVVGSVIVPPPTPTGAIVGSLAGVATGDGVGRTTGIPSIRWVGTEVVTGVEVVGVVAGAAVTGALTGDGAGASKLVTG